MKIEISKSTRFYKFPAKTTPQEIIKSSRSWIGTRFRYHGRIKINEKNRGGVDCLGLILGVADELQAKKNDKLLSFYDNISYKKIPQKNQLRDAMDKYFTNINPKDILIGDIALFQINKEIQHLGILSNIGLIHCYIQAKGVVEHRLSGKTSSHPNSFCNTFTTR